MTAELRRVAFVGMDMLASAFVYLTARPDLEVALLVTGLEGSPSAGVKRHARLIGVETLEDPGDDALMAAVEVSGADLLVVAAYHRLLPAARLAAAGVTAVNLHPSLLPEGRGPAPMAHFALFPELRAAAGVTMHLLSEGFDEGPILARQPIELAPEDGYDAIEAKMFAVAPALVARLLDEGPALIAAAEQQRGGSYWPRPDDALRTLKPGASVAEAQALARATGGYAAAIELVGGQRFNARILWAVRVAHSFPVGAMALFDGKKATITLADGLMCVTFL